MGMYVLSFGSPFECFSILGMRRNA